MNKEEAIKVLNARPYTGEVREALETLIPELKESEDERIRKEIITFIRDEIDEINLKVSGDYDDRDKDDIEHQKWCEKAIAYLEKQKEQKEETLRDFIDNFPYNEQKEQKPATINDEWIEDYWQHEKVNNPESYNKGEEIQFDHNGFVRFCKLYCQQPAEWSEEDSNRIGSIRSTLSLDIQRDKDYPEIIEAHKRDIKWLDSLYENESRPQQKKGWSEEDDSIIAIIENALGTSRTVSHDSYLRAIDWLKSLHPQPKQELAIAKAEQWLDDTFSAIYKNTDYGRKYCEISTHQFDSLEEMYDSFEKAVTVDCHSHWKPSEEQMAVLNAASKNQYLKTAHYDVLVSLYNDLLKL